MDVENMFAAIKRKDYTFVTENYKKSKNDEYYVFLAALHQHVDILYWLVDKTGQLRGAFYGTAISGNTQIFYTIYKLYGQFIYQYMKQMVKLASYNNNIEFLKYMEKCDLLIGYYDIILNIGLKKMNGGLIKFAMESK